MNRQTKHEIKRVINQHKNGKAADPDGVHAEAIKADTYVSVGMIYNLLGKIWNEESVPSDGKHGHIIKLPTKWDLGECNNWRGITIEQSLEWNLSLYICFVDFEKAFDSIDRQT